MIYRWGDTGLAPRWAGCEADSHPLHHKVELSTEYLSCLWLKPFMPLLDPQLSSVRCKGSQ